MSGKMNQDVLKKILAGETLSRQEMGQWLSEAVSGCHPDTVISAVLATLSFRGESVQELSGALDALKQLMTPFPLPLQTGFFPIDTCGTGGDGMGTFNISTTVSLVLAAGGVPVAKHGGRAVSSRSGSADVLEALGICVDLPVERSLEIFKELGIVFLWAPLYHPALKGLAPLRRSLGVRTFLNLIAPLANPARVTRQVLGVSSETMVRRMAELLQMQGATEFIVVCGQGLDEVTLEGRTTVAFGNGQEIHEGILYPRDFELPLTPISAIRGGDPIENAAIIRRVLSGEEGPYMDYVLANAALAFQVSGRVSGPAEGVLLARNTIMTGKAGNLLDRWVAMCQQKF